jgi:hypothetical protein
VRIALIVYAVGVIGSLGYVVLAQIDSWHRQVTPKPLSRSWWLQRGDECLAAILWPLLPLLSWARRKREYLKNRRTYRRLKAANDPVLEYWDASKYE